jgi:CHAT domain-containing protein
VARTLADQNKWADAEPFYREALAMRRALSPKEKFPDGQAELATSLHDLAAALSEQDKPAEAEPLYREALELRRAVYPKEQFPKGQADLAQTINNLGVVLRAQSQYAAAEEAYREALAMRRALYGADEFPQGHALLAQTLINLANALWDQNKPLDAEPFLRESLAMRRALYTKERYPDGHVDIAANLDALARLLSRQGRYAESAPLQREALDMRRAMYPKAQYPDGHSAIIHSLNALALHLQESGQLSAAEPFYREALTMSRALYPKDKYPDGHHDLALTLSNMAYLQAAQGQLSVAKTYCSDALAMKRRLYPRDKYPNGDDDLTTSLNNMAGLLEMDGQHLAAEILYREALSLYRALYPKTKFPSGHPMLALGLNNLAALLRREGRLDAAEPLLRESLDICRDLFPRDKYPNGHPDLGGSMLNLAFLLEARGQWAAAEPLLREGLAIYRLLYPKIQYPNGHPHLAIAVSALAYDLHARGQLAATEPLYREALEIRQTLVENYAQTKSETDTLNFVATFAASRDPYLSVTRTSSAATTYSVIWRVKAGVTRTYEARHLANRLARQDLALQPQLDELVKLRREREQLILSVMPADASDRAALDARLNQLAERIDALDRSLRGRVPAVDHADRLAKTTPADLQAALPENAVLIDVVRYLLSEHHLAGDGKDEESLTENYVAFVVAKKAVARVELGPAQPLEKVLALWRRALTDPSCPLVVERQLASKMRDLLWAQLQPALPPGTTTIYVSPDRDLAFLPWAALPGAKTDSILLEDFAFAVAPHGPFLLDRLRTAPEKSAAKGVLVVGGVNYDATPATPSPNPRRPSGAQQVHLLALPYFDHLLKAVTPLAKSVNQDICALSGTQADAASVLRVLPAVRYAHLHTHGYFADAAVLSILQLDPKIFAQRLSSTGEVRERIGHGAKSPLVLSGLAFAGANRPETPGRGIVTGETLQDLDLSGMELAVLSACQTGLGQAAGGEGVFGLQRALHMAGCRNVVASLWSIYNGSTLVFMEEYYANLWTKKLPPIEALRQAQLSMYRDPKRFIKAVLSVAGQEEKAASIEHGELDKLGRTPPVFWAAFQLSGPGR